MVAGLTLADVVARNPGFASQFCDGWFFAPKAELAAMLPPEVAISGDPPPPAPD
jgi:hypothetical protein